MHRCTAALLYFLGLCLPGAWGQGATLERISLPAGSVVTFHVQSRLNPDETNARNLLPQGTVLRVRLAEAIDSDLERDGAEFHGVVTAPVYAEKVERIHAEARVHGIFVLLRSRNHPDGFRYELLITGIEVRGKTVTVTASLGESLGENAPAASRSASQASNGLDSVASSDPSQSPATSKLQK